MSRVDDVLAAVSRLADPSSGPGRAARDAGVRETALSSQMAERVFALTCARYQRPALEALSVAGYAGQRVSVLLAASVATASLRAIALPWLGGASQVRVRASRSQRCLVDAVVGAFERDEIARVDELAPDAQVAVAYGSDDTLRALREALPPGVRFEGKGHGFGLAIARSAADAREVALDVALYDQRGCLSPQAVFVCGDAVAFARALHAELDALERELPRGRIAPGEGAAVAQWQGVMAARCAWFRRGVAHGVGLVERPMLAPTPGLRNVIVCPAEDVAEVVRAVGDQARFVTCVGVAGDTGEAEKAFPGARVVRVGTMQDPSLDGPEDRRTQGQ